MGTAERVVICGGGPVGLICALALVRHGIPVTVCEAQNDPPRDPRAATTHPPTLEMLDDLGLIDQVHERGLVAPTFQFRDRRSGEVVAVFDHGVLEGETRYPYVVQCEQWKLAEMARDALAQHDLAELLFGMPVTGIAQSEDGVTATVSVDGKQEIELHGRYLIGCDGGRSLIRKQLQIDFPGFTYPERFLVMAMTHDFAQSGGYIYRSYVMDPVEWCAVFKVPHDGPPGLWRTLFPTDPEDSDEQTLSDESVDKRLKGLEASLSHRDTVHRNLYMVHQRVAARFRKGRCFLAGDAAHVNNPLGGLGLNGGIHDAVNLAGKMADVWFGRAHEEVFDRYDRQRRITAEEAVQAQTMANKRRLEARDDDIRRQNMAELKEHANDPAKAKLWLMRSSLIDSVRRAKIIE
jgi:3-(3-hydroxy-phenyl)propionate hydroxylase